MSGWDFEQHDLVEAGRIQREWRQQGFHWYVYLLALADDTYYVGKGSGGRYLNHQQRWGEYWVMFAQFCLFEAEAYAVEAETIAYMRQSGFVLLNRRCGRGGAFLYAGDRVHKERERRGSPAYRARLKAQAVAMGALPRVRQVRSETIQRLNADEGFLAKKRSAVQARYALRRQALSLLKTNQLPLGFELPRNNRTGGTVKFWQQLLQALTGADHAR